MVGHLLAKEDTVRVRIPSNAQILIYLWRSEVMKYIKNGQGLPTLELTERNLRSLLEKLSDPHSVRTLMDPDMTILVKAVPDEEHYSDRDPGPVYTNGEYK